MGRRNTKTKVPRTLKCKCGIYVIRHIDSCRVYVGQAADITRRWSVHRYWLRNNKHHCTYLQRLWNKYGEPRFKFSVIKYCGLCSLNELETYWFNYYRSKNLLINIHPPGKGARGYNLSKSACEAISKVQKKIGTSLVERHIRSERAKKQHKEGRFGNGNFGKGKPRTCRKCYKKFIPDRVPTGGLSQSKFCKPCRPIQVGGYYKFFKKPS